VFGTLRQWRGRELCVRQPPGDDPLDPREHDARARHLAGQAGIETVYGVCHNIARFERFELDGQKRRVCVHREGATRAYPAGHPQTPAAYRDVGQPVIIPGDMGRYSYVMAGNRPRQRRDVRLIVPCRGPATEPRRREAELDGAAGHG